MPNLPSARAIERIDRELALCRPVVTIDEEVSTGEHLTAPA
jgi:hypothetical protein